MSAKDRKKGKVLGDDACPSCGTIMVEKRSTLQLPVNGEEVAVPFSVHLRCLTCDEVVLRFSDSRRLSQDAISRYRLHHGLLSADEIRSIRKHFHLTQNELARLLRLGATTVSRWESGRNVQTAAMDLLLRVLRDLPGGIEYLRKNAA